MKLTPYIPPDLEKEKQFFLDHDLMLSASSAQQISANGKGLDTYTTRLVREHFEGFDPYKYTNEDIERGNEYEPFAADYYEKKFNVKLETSPFIKCGEHWGVSPDRMVGKNGMVEIKVVNDLKYQDIKDGLEKPESKYLWQTQMQLLGTGRKWDDLMYYNRKVSDNGEIIEDCVVFRQYPDSDKFVKLEEGIMFGTQMIKDKLKKYVPKS